MVKDASAKTFPSEVPEPWTKELYVFGRHVRPSLSNCYSTDLSQAYFGDERLSLHEIFFKLQQDRNLSKVRYVHISCDVLDCNVPENDPTIVLSHVFDLLPFSSRLRYIHVYARELTVSTPRAAQVLFINNSDFNLKIVYDKVPAGMSVVFTERAGDAGHKVWGTACELFSDQIDCPKYASGNCPNGHFPPTLGATGVQLKSRANSTTVQSNFILSDVELGGSSVDDFKTFGGTVRRTE
jgi:hypothetical protein